MARRSRLGRTGQVEGLDHPKFVETYFQAVRTHFRKGEKHLEAGERFVDQNS